MKRIDLLLFALIAMIFTASCTKGRENRITEIRELEKNKLFSNEGKPDKEMGNKLIKAYIAFADDFPVDSLSPEFLFAASRINVLNANYQPAIDILNRIIENYPDNKRMPDCLFTRANIYETYLHNLVEARKSYEKLIADYPEHPFSQDAAILIENLGKSPEELLESILKKNEELSIAE